MYIARRYILMSLILFAGIIDKFIRVALSMAIIPISEEEHWSENTKGLVLSAFFWGYSTTQVFGGQIAMRIGGKHAVGFALAGGCPFVIAFPFCVKWIPLAVLTQLFCGLSHSIIYPSLFFLIGQWYPSFEQGTMIAVMNCGGIMGMIISWGVSPLIIKQLGWPSLFFIAGGAGIFWLVPWLLITLDSPQSSGFTIFPVHSSEIQYVQENQEKRTISTSNGVPWKRILTSFPILILTWNQFVSNWIYYLWMNWLPTFYKEQYQPSLEKVGLYSLIPMLVYIPVLFLSGFSSDRIIRKNLLSKKTVRRMFMGTYYIFVITALCILSFLDLELSVAVVVIIFAFATCGFCAGGKDPNFLDITPKYASSLFGFANCVGSLPGVIGVYATGYILDVTNDNWSVIFLITAGLAFSALILWTLFVRTDPIDFDQDEDEYLLQHKKKKERSENEGKGKNGKNGKMEKMEN